MPLSVKSDSDWNRTLIECLSVSCVDIEVRNGIEAPRGRGVDVHGRGCIHSVGGSRGSMNINRCAERDRTIMKRLPVSRVDIGKGLCSEFRHFGGVDYGLSGECGTC